MKIVSWNINGLKSKLVSKMCIEALLDEFNADIICLQETLIKREKIDYSMINLTKYYAFYSFPTHEKDKSGLATFCKKDTAIPIEVSLGFSIEEYKGLDMEGRVLITDHQDFILINVHFPTSCSRDRVSYKMWFMYVIQEHIEYWNIQGRKVIMCGDLGFGFKEIDHWSSVLSTLNAKLNSFGEHRGRKWMHYLLSEGGGRFYDAFRLIYPKTTAFTYWKTPEMRANNRGARVDYFIINKKVADQQLQNIKILSTFFISDHAPVMLELLLEQLSNIPEYPPAQCAIFYPEFGSEQSNLGQFFEVPNSNTRLVQKNRIRVEEEDSQSMAVAAEGPLCYHNEGCVVLEVKKEGRNKGRPFYSCRRPPGNKSDPDSRCGFFMWGDDKTKAPRCQHREYAGLKPVRKEGKNQGRWFYACKRNSDNSRCDFFQWAFHLDNLSQSCDV